MVNSNLLLQKRRKEKIKIEKRQNKRRYRDKRRYQKKKRKKKREEKTVDNI